VPAQQGTQGPSDADGRKTPGTARDPNPIAEGIVMPNPLRTCVPFVLMSTAGIAQAQCPDWSDGFVPAGMDGRVKAFAVYDSGDGPHLYAGGEFQRAGGESAPCVARLEGDRWKPLTPAVGGFCTSLAVYDDGSGPALFIGGQYLTVDGVAAGNLVRWNDVTAGPLGGGGPDGGVNALAVFDGGGTGPVLYVGGVFENAGAQYSPGVARWNGALWNSVGGVLHGWQHGYVQCLHVGSDANGPALFVGGYFDIAGGVPVASVARFDGVSWSGLGAGIGGGYAQTISTWSAPTGPQVVVGGFFDTAGGMPVHHIAAWDGASWSDLGGGVSTTLSPFGVRSLRVYDSGAGARLYAAGYFDSAGGVPSANIAAWDGTSWSPLSSGLFPTQGETLGVADLGAGPLLLVGGDFTSAGGVLADRVASFDGAQFHPIGAANALSYGDDVHAMIAFDDGTGTKVWLGGMSNGAGDVGQTLGAVRFDGTSWSAAPVGIRIETFARFDDGGGERLYAGGAGTAFDCVARWENGAWQALPGGPPPSTTCTSLCAYDDGTGPALYMGTIGGHRLYRWRDHAWSAVAPEPNGGVDQLYVHDDGNGPSLFVGGRFTQVGGVPMSTVARFDGTSWFALGPGLPQPPSGGVAVHSFVTHDDGSGAVLYVGGTFQYGLQRWNGSVWSPLGLGPSNEVFALERYDDGSGKGSALYAAGFFATAPFGGVRDIARWDGASWSTVGTGISSVTTSTTVKTLCTFDDGTTRALYAGGNFQLAGGHVSQGFARIASCGQTGELFCFGDGSSGACPCGNESAPADRAGCRNSLGTGGVLRAHGRATLSGDTMSLDGSAMTNSAVLYVQGAHSSSGVPFGDGIKCTAGPFVRLGTRTNVGGASSFPGGMGPSLSVRGQVFAPGTRTYQARYRNAAAFCTSDTFNYTNAVELAWGP
jgi:hypothetical protein